MKNFEVHYSFSGIIEVHTEDEADAKRQVQEMDHAFLLNRLSSENLLVSAASEIDVGGPG